MDIYVGVLVDLRDRHSGTVKSISFGLDADALKDEMEEKVRGLIISEPISRPACLVVPIVVDSHYKTERVLHIRAVFDAINSPEGITGEFYVMHPKFEWVGQQQ